MVKLHSFHSITGQVADMASTSSIALSGMIAAQSTLQSSAHNMANVSTPGFQRQQVAQTTQPAGGVASTVAPVRAAGSSIEADVISQLQAKNSFLANLAVFKTGDSMRGALLDVMA
jgi:flagellar basal body rod protein FlgG